MIKIEAARRLASHNVKAAHADEAAAIKYIESVTGISIKPEEYSESDDGVVSFPINEEDTDKAAYALFKRFGKDKPMRRWGNSARRWTVDKGRYIEIQYSGNRRNAWITLIDDND